MVLWEQDLELFILLVLRVLELAVDLLVVVRLFTVDLGLLQKQQGVTIICQSHVREFLKTSLSKRYKKKC